MSTLLGQRCFDLLRSHFVGSVTLLDAVPGADDPASNLHACDGGLCLLSVPEEADHVGRNDEHAVRAWSAVRRCGRESGADALRYLVQRLSGCTSCVGGIPTQHVECEGADGGSRERLYGTQVP